MVGEEVEQRHLQQEEEVGVQRRKPSICECQVSSRTDGKRLKLTLAMGEILYDLVAIRATFIAVDSVGGMGMKDV